MKIGLIHNPSLNSKKFINNKQKLIDDLKSEGFQVIEIDSTNLIHLSNSYDNFFDFSCALFYDKDINIAKLLEEQGILLFNSSKAIANCDNKITTYLELKKHKLPIIDTIIGPKVFQGYKLNNYDFVDQVIDKLGLPLIIKEAYGSLGEQVYLLNNKEEIILKINQLIGKEYLFQKFIASSSGQDIRINVIGNRVVASMIRKNDLDFRSNISQNGKGYLYQPTPKQKQLAIDSVEALGLDFAGVDLIVDGNQTYIVEVNSNVQTSSIIEVSNIEVNRLLAQYIKNKVKEKYGN